MEALKKQLKFVSIKTTRLLDGFETGRKKKESMLMILHMDLKREEKKKVTPNLPLNLLNVLPSFTL